jgi:hypothetical protein
MPSILFETLRPMRRALGSISLPDNLIKIHKAGKERIMHFENIEAIVDFAIAKEREAAAFYKKISKEEKDFRGSKKMFAEFAEEEQKHEKLLQDLKATGISKSLQEYKLKWITDIKRSDYLVDVDYGS